MYEDPNIAIQKFVTEIDPSAISKQKVIGVGECLNLFTRRLVKPQSTLSDSCPSVCLPTRRVWGGVLGRDEESWPRGGGGSHQDLKAGILGETEAGLPE